MSFACPACHSQDIRRLQIIYREGSSTMQATTSAGAARAYTSGTQQTLLSRGAAPPEKKKVGGLVVGVVLGALFLLGGMSSPGAGLLFGLALAGICGWLLKQALDYNGQEFPRLFKRWENTFMCNRCGEHFIPATLTAPAIAGA
ncbi:hypothetical protein [Longimicrobium sp.]|uniref:hypothetical protein n=1 Tax=Longimicrobium sp. TaxID=2029185 RepID=UPI002E360480|nr:hypothetical protein [Longimicrobium sp.]HEX6040127.1 hypothetical protein [Longimicrobium sp.]